MLTYATGSTTSSLATAAAATSASTSLAAAAAVEGLPLPHAQAIEASAPHAQAIEASAPHAQALDFGDAAARGEAEGGVRDIREFCEACGLVKVCSRMLTYAHVCSRELTCADEFGSMWG